jgi:hypothetical protein
MALSPLWLKTIPFGSGNQRAPSLETLAGGRNLTLGFANTILPFDNTARLAGFVYAVAVQSGQATSFVTNLYHDDLNWLNHVDQPMLDVAQNWSDNAALAAVQGQNDQAKINRPLSRLAGPVSGA